MFTNQLGEVCVLIERNGQETIGQLLLASELASRDTRDIIVVSTLFHHLRVRYLCRKMNVVHRVSIGIPNIAETCTNIVLLLLFPLIDKLGYAQHFQKWVIKHRESGKHL
ncbi:MAG: hypothetical protein NUV54_01205 [Candidatus Taylorbacteria bacterium]|nr:hypothetical protein [Candidatus Taylorbacteria bacterium]